MTFYQIVVPDKLFVNFTNCSYRFTFCKGYFKQLFLLTNCCSRIQTTFLQSFVLHHLFKLCKLQVVVPVIFFLQIFLMDNVLATFPCR